MKSDIKTVISQFLPKIFDLIHSHHLLKKSKYDLIDKLLLPIKKKKEKNINFLLLDCKSFRKLIYFII